MTPIPVLTLIAVFLFIITSGYYFLKVPVTTWRARARAGGSSKIGELKAEDPEKEKLKSELMDRVE